MKLYFFCIFLNYLICFVCAQTEGDDKSETSSQNLDLGFPDDDDGGADSKFISGIITLIKT